MDDGGLRGLVSDARLLSSVVLAARIKHAITGRHQIDVMCDRISALVSVTADEQPKTPRLTLPRPKLLSEYVHEELDGRALIEFALDALVRDANRILAAWPTPPYRV